MSVLNCEVLHIPDGVHIASFSHAQPCPCHGYPRSTVGGDAVSGAQARLEVVRAYACRASTVVVVEANPTQDSLPLGTSNTLVGEPNVARRIRGTTGGLRTDARAGLPRQGGHGAQP